VLPDDLLSLLQHVVGSCSCCCRLRGLLAAGKRSKQTTTPARPAGAGCAGFQAGFTAALLDVVFSRCSCWGWR
jgi:hypothetical protein